MTIKKETKRKESHVQSLQNVKTFFFKLPYILILPWRIGHTYSTEEDIWSTTTTHGLDEGSTTQKNKRAKIQNEK